MKSPDCARRADRGAALPSGRRAEIGAAHRLSPAAARQGGRGEARGVAGQGAAEHPPLRQVQHLHRGGAVRAVRLAQARRLAAVRGRDAGRPADDGADAGVQRPVLRAHGARCRRSTASARREIGLDVMQRRLADGEVKEVIVATNFTNEGEATAHYIGEMLKGPRPARHAHRARRPGRRRAGVRGHGNAGAGRRRAPAGMSKPLEGRESRRAGAAYRRPFRREILRRFRRRGDQDRAARGRSAAQVAEAPPRALRCGGTCRTATRNR